MPIPNQAMAKLMVDSIRDYAVFMIDPAGRILNWNTGATRIMGYSSREIVGQDFSIFYPRGSRAVEPRRALVTAARKGHYDSEGWQLRKDGSRFWASVVIEPVFQKSGQIIGFAEVTRDTTERRLAEQALRTAKDELERRVEERTRELQALNAELERLADTDSLTGIPNRRSLMNIAAHEMRRSKRYHKPFAVLFVDLDDFKTINDTFGHAAGDEALRMVVAQMGRQLRGGDVMARIGGDEFVLLLLETTIDGAKQMAERLCREVASTTIEADGKPFSTIVSVGVAQWHAGETFDQLLARADGALYAAKKEPDGGRVVIADPPAAAENAGPNPHRANAKKS